MATRTFARPVSAWLAAIAGSLLIVGVVSGTLIRHVIQIAPLVLALLLVRRSPAAASAAAPLFAFWLLVMLGIWSFFLGIARIFPGTFTPLEIALTIIIGIASLTGLVTTARSRSTIPMPARLALIAGFAVLQCVAMWTSMQPFVSR
jgi:hypothetical protein